MIDVPTGKVNFLRRLADSPFLEIGARDWSGAAMVAALDAGAVEDGAVGGVLDEDLAFQDSAVFEREMEDVAERGLRHGVKPYDCCRPVQTLQDVADAPEDAMTTV